jgi:hypothetical protein
MADGLLFISQTIYIYWRHTFHVSDGQKIEFDQHSPPDHSEHMSLEPGLGTSFWIEKLGFPWPSHAFITNNDTHHGHLAASCQSSCDAKAAAIGG